MNKIVRRNLMTNKNYTPYCGAFICPSGMPRTEFDKNLNQFVCQCGWFSSFPETFILKYRKKHNI